MSTSLFFSIFFILANLRISHALIEGLYCGMENCYVVLGVTRDADKGTIGKSYRILARKFHPDMHKSSEAKKEAEVKFRAVANAYEILKDDETRKDYDNLLDNPDEYYSHYFAYYRRRLSPKVDVRIVIAVTITLISAFQYYSGWQRYKMAIDYFASTEKYRKQAIFIAEKENMMPDNPRGKNKKSKEELKQEKELVIRKVIESKMDIKGACEKPSITNVLWVQIALLPLTVFVYFKFYLRWFWKFYFKGEEYGIEEKAYIIRRFMGLTQLQFDALDEHQHEDFLHEKLWLKPNFLIWKEKKDEEMRIKMAEDPRVKRYRRYMRNHGPETGMDSRRLEYEAQHFGQTSEIVSDEVFNILHDYTFDFVRSAFDCVSSKYPDIDRDVLKKRSEALRVELTLKAESVCDSIEDELSQKIMKIPDNVVLTEDAKHLDTKLTEIDEQKLDVELKLLKDQFDKEISTYQSLCSQKKSLQFLLAAHREAQESCSFLDGKVADIKLDELPAIIAGVGSKVCDLLPSLYRSKNA
ncbi:hypothetical protein CHUAL_001317 [Chamberlinius hualienensis]